MDRRILYQNDEGAAALEFAMVLPLLLIFLLGLVAYGGFFWMSHGLQQLANDGARASISGLTTPERVKLASDLIQQEAVSLAQLDPQYLKATTVQTGDVITTTVIYDATRTPYYALAVFTPLPSRSLQASASIRSGGY